MGRRRLLPAITFAVALLTAVVLTLVPSYSTESCVADGSGPAVCESSTQTLLEHEGTSVLLVLLVPAAVALVGVLVPKPVVLGVIAWLLAVACFLGAMSIGVFYLPTLLSAIVVASVSSSRRTRRPRPGTAPAA
jgi:hypothetical protein